jgi:hypothetical protein
MLGGGLPVPSWIKLDTVKPSIMLDPTPAVTTSTTFTFSLLTEWSFEKSYKDFYINVSPWQVEHCSRWDTYSDVWGQWEDGYETRSGKWEQVISKTAGVVRALSQTMLAIGIGANVASAILTSSSPQGAFSMINQFQMLLLLPLIGAHIPFDIVQIIIGMDFTLFSFNFIPFAKTPGITVFASVLDAEQRNEYLETIGLESESSFVNNLSIVFTVLLTLCAHGVVYFIYRRVIDVAEPKWYQKALIKVFEALTISVYIRTIMEAYLFVWISSFSEIKYAQFGSTAFVISFTISLLLMVASLLVIGTLVCQILKAHPEFSIESQWAFRELFAGLKNTTFSRLFPLFFCLNRFLWVVIVVFLKEIALDAKTVIFSTLQLLLLIYLTAVRPLESKKDMLIELTNQVILVVLSCLLIHFKSEGNWNTLVKFLYMGMITLGVWVGITLSIFDAAKTFILRIKSYFEKSNKLSKVIADPSNSGMGKYLPSNMVKSSDVTVTTTQNDSSLVTGKDMMKKTYDLSYSEVRPKYPKIM